ncbi:hypothetical protein [Mycolicibacterium frederiksbergense]|uniref:hypothetical protein n=1 Tax=Mycolicibacterium frederiksbergense TaxID=117567 RepID=UPI002473777A|nr:hypothetical protein [Mycolicibacterium frederiksbergense]
MPDNQRVPMPTTVETVLSVVAVLSFAAFVTFLVLFIVSRRQLTSAPREAELKGLPGTHLLYTVTT